MVDMITVTRAYEANQKVLQAQDGTLEKAVNQVGALKIGNYLQYRLSKMIKMAIKNGGNIL